MKHMRLNIFLAFPLVTALLTSCGGELPPGKNPETTPSVPAPGSGIPALGLFAIKASNGMYVSCSMTPDSSGKVTLFANREKVGPNEVFTGWDDEAGHRGIMAPNGKYISAEREPGGLLVAKSDYVGEWEYFELIPQGDGLFALKNSNGKFVGPHYEWPGARANQLCADRSEPNEWERFTIVQDPAIGQ
jgi:hypothetical protein